MFEAATKPEKVSDRIIEQIRDAILSGRLKPGVRLASEKELVAQFGVSKATMREALRVLEAMGLVEIRKGTQGGVFIAEVDMKTTIHGIMNFLHFRSVSVRDITMLRFMIEPSVAHLAALVRSQEDIVCLREMVHIGEEGRHPSDQEISFHRYLARLIGNPLLILVMDFLDNLLRDLKLRLDLQADFYGQVRESHSQILECIIKQDCVGARQMMAADLLAVGNYLAEHTGTPRFQPEMLGFNEQARYTPHLATALINGQAPLSLGSPEVQAQDEAATGRLRRGMFFRQVDSGELYVMVPVEETAQTNQGPGALTEPEETVGGAKKPAASGEARRRVV